MSNVYGGGVYHMCMCLLPPPCNTILVVFFTDDQFEDFEIVPYSVPPELPDVMRAQEGSTGSGGTTD